MITEIRYQVGEAWKGTYDATTEYSKAAVVKDPVGLSIYRSLKSGNVGHPLSDTSWWFCIIDMRDIKATKDEVDALNITVSLAEEARQDAEAGRERAEKDRVSAEADRVTAEEIRNDSEHTRGRNEQSRIDAETERNNAETARNNAEAERDNAENNPVTGRVAKESARVSAEADRQIAENNRVQAEQERVNVFNSDHALSEELNTHPMRINTTTGTWERWDEDNNEYVDTGIMAMASPYSTFEIDTTTGQLVMTFEADYAGPTFILDQTTGNLTITI